MILYGKHSRTTKATGVGDFAEWLDRVSGVNKVMVNNYRTRKVGPGKKDEPKFRSLRHCVEVAYCNEGILQIIRVFPQKVVSAHELYQRLTAAWAQSQRRGGIGMSPKDPVHIPGHIRRRQEEAATMSGTTNGTPTSSRSTTAVLDPPSTPEVPVSSTSTTSPATVNQNVVKLSQAVADVYHFILDLDPSGKLEFQVDRLYGRAADQFGTASGNHLKVLKEKGLILPIEPLSSGFATKKSFMVLRRPYEVTVTTATPKKSAPKGKPASESDDHDTLEGHLKFFAKHRELLEEADRRRKSLAKKGFEMIDVRGRLAFVPKK